MKEAHLVASAYQFSEKYLGRSRNYYSVLKARNMEPSIGAILTLEYELQKQVDVAAAVSIMGIDILEAVPESAIGGYARLSRAASYKSDLTQRFNKNFLHLFEQKELKPIIDSVYPWNEIDRAHQRMEQNLNIGKIILQLD